MVHISPARIAPSGVRLTGPEKQTAKPYTFTAPVRGWITNENIARANPGGAAILDNFVPEQYSLRVRGGNLKWATVHATDECEALIGYASGSQTEIFAATASAIYDISAPASPTAIPTAKVTGQTSGDWSHVNIATAGGEFVVMVNGADRMLSYDGTDWRNVDTATTELAYDAETGTFAEGLVVTGGTSGATGTIVELIDNGTTGTLRLSGVTGTFQDNETITDSSTGSATSNIPSGTVAIPAITGDTTDNMTAVWTHKSRLWALKKQSLLAYYLPVDSIGGALGTLSLRGVMKKGGSLIIGATWSMDAGDGLDDYCVFVSDQGEVAVYQGTDPSSSNTWALVGVYVIPRPLHKNATMVAGGNLLIVTEEGLIPISSAVRRDRAAIALDAVSMPIEPTWRFFIADRPGRWVACKWTNKNYAIIGFPAGKNGVHDSLVVNLRTGAWARFTGWDINCALESNGDLYLGTSTGFVTKAEALGTDNGANYSCLFVGMYESLDTTSFEKIASMGRATFEYKTEFNFELGFTFNYDLTLNAYPSIAAISDVDVWDTGLWDVAVWHSGTTKKTQFDWQSVSGRGFTVAPVLQIQLGHSRVADVNLNSIDLMYETGGAVV